MKMIPEQIKDYLEKKEKLLGEAAQALQSNIEISQSEGVKGSTGFADSTLVPDKSSYNEYLYYLGQLASVEADMEMIELPKPDKDSEKAEVGSYVSYIDSPSYIDYKTGKTIELDPVTYEGLIIEGELSYDARHSSDITFIPENSKVGEILLGSQKNEVKSFTQYNKKINAELLHTCIITTVDNSYIYTRYPNEYQTELSSGPKL